MLPHLLSRQKLQDKQPAWVKHPELLFTNPLSAEQCSSELTAMLKGRLMGTGERCIDLTGGLGADTAIFAKYFKEVHYVEMQSDLLAQTKHNFEALGIKNCVFHHADAASFLQNNLTLKADLVYIDPARRNESGQKTYHFSDCSPNVLELWPSLRHLATRLLIKTAPFLDISAALRELPQPAQIYVLAIRNECKEVLYCLGEGIEVQKCQTFNIQTAEQEQHFEFNLQEESFLPEASISEPQSYIYDPNVAILKAGAFKSLAQKMGLSKLHPHTHVYTHQTLIADFPGRIYKLLNILKPEKGIFSEPQATFLLRNSPLNLTELYQKMKLKPGGTSLLMSVRLASNEHKVLHLQPLSAKPS